jgi:AraC family transcriptional regulator of adaptative response/methylated-DNA-[protein]-cysteine methyltransferase
VTLAGSWWRFSNYELRQGLLQPAPGEQLKSYDLWRAVRMQRAGRLDAPPPHHELLQLLRRLERDGPRLSAAARDALLEWCSRYGLLGILHDRVHEISLAPRWEHPAAPIPKERVWPVRRRYVRASDRWVEITDYPPGFEEAFRQPTAPPRGFPVARTHHTGHLVAPSRVPKSWRPFALVRAPMHAGSATDLAVETYERQSLGDTIGRFFPNVEPEHRDTYPYPKPDSPEFWLQYAEPLEEFMRGAARLRDTLADLRDASSPADGDDLALFSNVAHLSRGLNSLHALTAAVRPVLLPVGRARYAYRSSAASLLESLAMMALLDEAAGRGERRCARWGCGLPFTPRTPQAEYCSPRCREADKKARQRRRFRARIASRQPTELMREHLSWFVPLVANGRGMHVRYAVVTSSLGPLLVAATPQGICAVRFGRDADALRAELQRELPFAEITVDEEALGTCVERLLRSLAGDRSALQLPLHVECTFFQRQAWAAIMSIPAGSTRSYGQIAKEVRRPRAARAVARACAMNPAALLIPSHRVVDQHGALRGYRWGSARQRALLAVEGYAPAEGRRRGLGRRDGQHPPSTT